MVMAFCDQSARNKEESRVLVFESLGDVRFARAAQIAQKGKPSDNLHDWPRHLTYMIDYHKSNLLAMRHLKHRVSGNIQLKSIDEKRRCMQALRLSSV